MGLQDRLDKAAQRTAEQLLAPAPAALAPVATEGTTRAPTPAPNHDGSVELKSRILKKIIAEIDPKLDSARPEELRQYIEQRLDQSLEEDKVIVGRVERQVLLDQLVADITGYGPIEPYLKDPTIDEIMVNGADELYVERAGIIEEVPNRFESDQHVMRIIDRIVSPLGRRVDEAQPFVDARLPDGSRVNIIIPPLALNGPIITIRKFAKVPFMVSDLIVRGTFTPEFVELIQACVEAELNIVISGGTGAGKTTLLNVISAFIPPRERVITIEDAAELQLQQRHVLSLETRAPNIEGKGEVTRRDLVVNALRMRPDRIIIGECRAGEALDMLQAMNTGHEGSMTTVHANSPRDALHRIETMVLMAGFDLPLRAIREQISSALDLIVHLDRLRDGSRKVVSVVEIQGMEGDVVVTQEIFKFELSGPRDGRVEGRLKPTGIRPKFMDKIEAAGLKLPPAVFGADALLYH
jgi:pilus assembly protein CpaF